MHDTTTDQLCRYRRTHDRGLRNALVEAHRDVAERVARRYVHGTASMDDLRQVAVIGVLKAVERFDPALGVDFERFAAVTATGELKRYLRDCTWAVHVPRGAQDLAIRLRSIVDHLQQCLRRPPTIRELAHAAGATVAQVSAALDAGAAARCSSLSGGDEGGREGSNEARLSQDDRGFDDADTRALVHHLLDRLPPRERRIVEMRYFEDKVQAVIAQELGLSQMHVSRLLTRSLQTLRSIAEHSA